MNKTLNANQKSFDLHLEYKEKAALKEKDYRELEGKFALAFGYLPIRIEDNTFPYLSERQQDACKAFWGNLRVITARNEMTSYRSLADAFFNAFADTNRKSL